MIDFAKLCKIGVGIEKWRAIPGYEGMYEASDQGRIRSLDRVITHAGAKRCYAQSVKGRILRPGPCSKLGHLSVALGRNNSQLVHYLVMLAFKGPRPDGLDIAHRDGNPANNCLANLRYSTRSDNNFDKAEHGRTKISSDVVDFIRSSTLSSKELATILSIPYATVWEIKTFRSRLLG